MSLSYYSLKKYEISLFYFIAVFTFQSPNLLLTLTLPDSYLVRRISVTCRDGKLYSVKNGDLRGSAILIGKLLRIL